MICLKKILPDVDDFDLEYVISLEDEVSPDTIMLIAYTDESRSEDESSKVSSDDSDLPAIQAFDQVITIDPSLSLIPDILSPSAKIHITLETYGKPIQSWLTLTPKQPAPRL